MNMMNKEPERHEIEALLPWHAAGTLNRRDADRVEQALAGDRELKRRYELVREELNETIHLNETLGAPSSRCMERLFAAIDAEGERKPARQGSFDLAGRISEFLSGFAPRTLAWSAAAAALAIMVQAAVITSVVVKEKGATFEVASTKTEQTGGAFLMIRFVAQASASDITHFLDAYKATLVDGPKAGGLFRVRLPSTSTDEFSDTMKKIQSESKIVSFVARAE
jgi:hypothetical protein